MEKENTIDKHIIASAGGPDSEAGAAEGLERPGGPDGGQIPGQRQGGHCHELGAQQR